MGIMQDRIDIALGFDAKYAPHAAAVVASVVQHAKNTEFRFIVIHSGIAKTIRSKVERVAPNAHFVWAEVSDNDLPPFADRGHFNRAILFRIGLEKLAPTDCKRVLYLDSDTIVLQDVQQLWNVDLGDSPIGAVVDCYADAEAFAKRWSLSGETPGYFNSGVLLIDLERVRMEGLFSAASDFVARNEADILFGDQDALNWVFWGRWRKLDVAWNVQRFMTSREIAGDPLKEGDLNGNRLSLVHFIGFEKPWMPGVWHPWAWLYWKNLARTPFAEDVAREFGMNFYQLTRLRLRWWIKRPRQVRFRSR
jgi:lipopolysaccharide biosynthesis glycosyltransferase